MPSLNCSKYEIPFKYIFILCFNCYDIGYSWGGATNFRERGWRHHHDIPNMLHATIPSMAFILTILIIGTLSRNASPRILIISFSFLRVTQWIFLLMPNVNGSYWISCSIAWIIFGLSLFLLTILPLYVEEISEIKHRRHFICILYFSMVFGNWISGLVLSLPDEIFFRITSHIISLIISLATSIANFYLPESPIWLISKGNHSQAKKTLKILRKNSDYIEDEFEIINLYLDSEQYKEQLSICSLIRNNLNYGKTFIFALVLFAFHGISGKLMHFPYNIDYYILPFDDAVTLNFTIVVLKGIFSLLGIIVCFYLQQYFGPRFVMLISTANIALIFVILSIYSNLIESSLFKSFPFVFIIIYIFMSFVGFEVIPFIVMSETFPFPARRTGAMLCLFVNLFININFQFVIYFSFAVRIEFILIIYSVLMIIDFIFIYILMPTEEIGLNRVGDSEGIEMRSTQPINL